MTGAGRSGTSWGAVAAEGTDPAQLRTAIALSMPSGGRTALAAALDGDAGLLDREAALATLPRPDEAARAAADGACRRWHELGVRVALRGDPGWPARLDRLSAAPPWLAWRGPACLPDGTAVAVVGARRATPYGTGVAAWLAEAAADAGVTVVSGGAVGIDAAAHEAAVEDGTTVVLGCGHDQRYPRPHARRGGLFHRVLDGGGAIVSELLPGESARPHNVRARNRIVAALADAVVVVEGRQGSGSLVTAGEAADLGVEVLAVPGDVRASGSAAPHQLLREGAVPCTGPADLLAVLRATISTSDEQPPPDLTVLPAPMAAVLAEAWPRPLRTDQVAARADLGIGAVLAAVTRARVAGVVVEGAEGIRLCRSPDSGN